MGRDNPKLAIRDYVRKNDGFPLILALASLVCLIAAAERCSNDDCDGDGEVFAVVGAAVSTIIVIVYIFYEVSRGIEETADLLIVAFLFIWWAVYAGYTTFQAPFTTTTNGYFGAWLGFFAATGLLVSKTRNAKSFLQEKADDLGLHQAIILVFSIVVILAAIRPCCSDSLAIIALVAGSGSIIFIFFRVVLELESSVSAIILSVWWLAFTIVLTFGLFLSAGNGYFGCWICLITSVMLVAKEASD